MTECPKCGLRLELVHEAKDDGEMPPDPWKQPWPVRGVACAKIYECTAHGRFGIGPDGEVVLEDAECYVLGPNGEELFRV